MIALLTALFEAVSQGLRLFPDWDQRKLDEYHNLIKRYENSLSLTPKDDNYTDWCREQLRLFIEAYNEKLRNLINTPKS